MRFGKFVDSATRFTTSSLLLSLAFAANSSTKKALSDPIVSSAPNLRSSCFPFGNRKRILAQPLVPFGGSSLSKARALSRRLASSETLRSSSSFFSRSSFSARRRASSRRRSRSWSCLSVSWYSSSCCRRSSVSCSRSYRRVAASRTVRSCFWKVAVTRLVSWAGFSFARVGPSALKTSLAGPGATLIWLPLLLLLLLPLLFTGCTKAKTGKLEAENEYDKDAPWDVRVDEPTALTRSVLDRRNRTMAGEHNNRLQTSSAERW
mmetsp:Transcript_25318/g.53994  ORF Transcript_25318/g.53994 Transcript_25318/m.53994 type:complete len:263 (-) Transcript_25318:438-1226(-)